MLTNTVLTILLLQISAKFLGEPDENSFGPPDVAQPIRGFVLDSLADELRAVFPESSQRIVQIIHREHDTQVTQSVHRGLAMIGDNRRREEAGYLEPAVPVRCTHHGDLDVHVAKSGDSLGPLPLDRRPAFEFQTELVEELDGGIEIFHHDADVVHPLDRHCT